MTTHQPDYPPDFKARVALAAISGNKALPLVSMDYDDVDIDLIKLWMQQLADHSADIFVRLAEEEKASGAEWEKQRARDYEKHAATLEQMHYERDLPFSYSRYWSTEQQLSANEIITGILMRPTREDIAKACALFGVETVLFVLEGLKRAGEERKRGLREWVEGEAEQQSVLPVKISIAGGLPCG